MTAATIGYSEAGNPCAWCLRDAGATPGALGPGSHGMCARHLRQEYPVDDELALSLGDSKRVPSEPDDAMAPARGAFLATALGGALLTLAIIACWTIGWLAVAAVAAEVAGR